MNYLFQIIEKIRIRPYMYLGSEKISDLLVFISGYILALDDLKITEKKILPLSINFFHDYVAKKFDYYESTSGWRKMILDQVKQNEEEALKLFYSLFDEFKQIKISSYFVSEIGNTQKEFHLSNKYTPRRIVDFENNITEPLYKNPKKIFYCELFDNKNFKGFVGIVQTDLEYIFERSIYKNEEDILHYFKSCFGDINWKKENADNIFFN